MSIVRAIPKPYAFAPFVTAAADAPFSDPVPPAPAVSAAADAPFREPVPAPPPPPAATNIKTHNTQHNTTQQQKISDQITRTWQQLR